MVELYLKLGKIKSFSILPLIQSPSPPLFAEGFISLEFAGKINL